MSSLSQYGSLIKPFWYQYCTEAIQYKSKLWLVKHFSINFAFITMLQLWVSNFKFVLTKTKKMYTHTLLGFICVTNVQEPSQERNLPLYQEKYWG